MRACRLSIEASDRAEELVTRLGDGCGFTRRSRLYVASKRSHVPKLKRERVCRPLCDFDVDYLEAERVREEYAFSASGAIRSAVDAEIDAFRLTHALLRQSRGMGLRA